MVTTGNFWHGGKISWVFIKKVKQDAHMRLMRDCGGSGKTFDMPPTDFIPYSLRGAVHEEGRAWGQEGAGGEILRGSIPYFPPSRLFFFMSSWKAIVEVLYTTELQVKFLEDFGLKVRVIWLKKSWIFTQLHWKYSLTFLEMRKWKSLGRIKSAACNWLKYVPISASQLRYKFKIYCLQFAIVIHSNQLLTKK